MLQLKITWTDKSKKTRVKRTSLARSANELSLIDLHEMISRFTSFPSFSLKYLDDDKDLVCLDDEQDLSTALQVVECLSIVVEEGSLQIPTNYPTTYPSIPYQQPPNNQYQQPTQQFRPPSVQGVLNALGLQQTQQPVYSQPAQYQQYSPPQQAATNPQYQASPQAQYQPPVSTGQQYPGQQYQAPR